MPRTILVFTVFLMQRPKTFAIDDELIGEIDGYVRRIAAQHPGLTISRSRAVRALLKSGLAAERREPSSS